MGDGAFGVADPNLWNALPQCTSAASSSLNWKLTRLAFPNALWCIYYYFMLICISLLFFVIIVLILFSLLSVIMHWLSYLESVLSKSPIVIILDVSVGFDTVDHGILLNPLKDQAGIQGTAL